MSTLHEDQYTRIYFILSGSVLLRMRKVSDSQFIFNNFLSTTSPLMR